MYCLGPRLLPNTSLPCPGDFNGDRVVNSADLSLARTDFGSCLNASSCRSDANNDAIVNLLDIVIALDHWGACPSASCLPRPSRLVNWWPGDTDAGDAVGTFGGVLLDNATLVGPTQALVGGGAFRGYSVWVPGRPSPGNSDFSLSLWVRLDSRVERGSLLTLLTWGSASMTLTENTLRFVIGSASNSPALDSTLSQIVILSQTWYNIVVTRSGAGMAMYLNGYLVDARNLADQFVTVGLPDSALRFSVEGVVTDDVMIYDVALTNYDIFKSWAAKKRDLITFCK